MQTPSAKTRTKKNKWLLFFHGNGGWFETYSHSTILNHPLCTPELHLRDSRGNFHLPFQTVIEINLTDSHSTEVRVKVFCQHEKDEVVRFNKGDSSCQTWYQSWPVVFAFGDAKFAGLEIYRSRVCERNFTRQKTRRGRERERERERDRGRKNYDRSHLFSLPYLNRILRKHTKTTTVDAFNVLIFEQSRTLKSSNRV